MKRLTNTLLAATAFVAAAGIASAQSMEANIPFAFQAGRTTFAAGTYRVQLQRSNSGNRMIRIAGKQPKTQMLAYGYAEGSAKTAWAESGNPVLLFHCGGGKCSLTDVWIGAAGEDAWRIPEPGLRKDVPVTTAEVVLHPIKAD